MIDFNSIFEQVLGELLPEKNTRMSTKTDWRYGSRGSLSYNTKTHTFFNHETQEGGGLLKLIESLTFYDDGIKWLIENGYATDTRGKAQENATLSSLDYLPATPEKRDETYVYSTPEGEPLYRLIRAYQGNDRIFKQERFDNDTGAWIAGLKDLDGNKLVEKTLYNLAELVSRPNEAVHIVEGEKDVVTLHKLGLLATTSGGAQSWRSEFAQYFENRDVVVIPDHDSAGAKYADAVINSLQGVAKSIKRVNLAQFWQAMPPKADVTDLIEAGATLADLEKIIQHTPFEGEPATAMQVKPAVTFARVGDALKNALKPIPWLVEGFFIKDTLAALVGKPSSGKSLISLSLAASIATGADWFGHKTQKGTVVYLAGEGQWGISRRLMAWSKHHNISLDEADLFLSDHAVMIDQPKAIVDTADAIRALSDTPSLIVIDTLHRSFSGDENSASDMAAFIQGCDYLRTQFPNAVVLVVHHSGHGNEVRARGSSSFHAALDTSYTIEGAESYKLMTQNKTKDGKPANPIKFEVVEVDIYETDTTIEQSITIRETDISGNMSKALSKPLAFAVETFAAVCDTMHEANLSEWRDVFYERHHGETVSAKKMAFNRARKDLLENGIMTVTNDRYTLLVSNPYRQFTDGILIASRLIKAQGMGANDDDFAMTEAF